MFGAMRSVKAASRASSLGPLSTLPPLTQYIARIEHCFPQKQRTRSLLNLSSFAASRFPNTCRNFRRTSSSLSKASKSEQSTVNSMSHLERLKDQWRKYGVVAIGTYLTMYGAVLGSIYLAIDRGWIHTSKTTNLKDHEKEEDDRFDFVTTTNRFVKLAEDLGIAQYLEIERVNAKTGSFLLAWIATKFTEPVRLALTIAVTPRIARFLGRAPKLPPKTPGKLASMMKKEQKTQEQQSKA
ncbi:unnamed protein product [Peronospora belbahrii]|uniref:DUF1279 domain-containing protein n=1 Tax=Peronospora belbahrii TaxID=622444 RepID=A0AAU9KSB1_9STRA|nr:unnamed protein product [Peronospora belbahrii]CAH0518849.1 unnamed protein product [Peronospora belbahrii]